MSEHEPSIDPQPGELGDGRVDVPGGTEITDGRAMGAGGDRLDQAAHDAAAGATEDPGNDRSEDPTIEP